MNNDIASLPVCPLPFSGKNRILPGDVVHIRAGADKTVLDKERLSSGTVCLRLSGSPTLYGKDGTPVAVGRGPQGALEAIGVSRNGVLIRGHKVVLVAVSATPKTPDILKDAGYVPSSPKCHECRHFISVTKAREGNDFNKCGRVPGSPVPVNCFGVCRHHSDLPGNK
jgi:hypothetical protein